VIEEDAASAGDGDEPEESSIHTPADELATAKEAEAEETAEEASEEIEEGAPEELPEHHKWYVVRTYSGYEQKAKLALQERIKQYHMQKFFSKVLIPS